MKKVLVALALISSGMGHGFGIKNESDVKVKLLYNKGYLYLDSGESGSMSTNLKKPDYLTIEYDQQVGSVGSVYTSSIQKVILKTNKKISEKTKSLEITGNTGTHYTSSPHHRTYLKIKGYDLEPIPKLN